MRRGGEEQRCETRGRRAKGRDEGEKSKGVRRGGEEQRCETRGRRAKV